MLTVAVSRALRNPGVQVFLLSNLILVFGLAASLLWFGSIDRAIAFVNGRSLSVDAQQKSVGSMGTDPFTSISFTLTNSSRHPIRIIGAASSCWCIPTEKLPVTIPPHAQFTLPVRIIRNPKVGEISELIQLFTDEEPPHPMILEVVGSSSLVQPAPSGE